MEPLISNISVDCVIFGLHNRKLSVLLTKRELTDPQTGHVLIADYTVQGHHVRVGENINDAAKRVLKDKTGLENIFLKQFYTFGETDRLLKEKDQLWKTMSFPEINNHVVSVGYYALVDSSKVKPVAGHSETKWFPVKRLPELGFDHDRIITMALDHLRSEIRREPIGYELLPQKFTLTQLQNLYEAILDVKLDKRNFRKKVSNMAYVIALNEKDNGPGKKPAQLFLFSWDVYEKTRKERMDYLI